MCTRCLCAQITIQVVDTGHRTPARRGRPRRRSVRDVLEAKKEGLEAAASPKGRDAVVEEVGWRQAVRKVFIHHLRTYVSKIGRQAPSNGFNLLDFIKNHLWSGFPANSVDKR
jgi:hypothetical protein